MHIKSLLWFRQDLRISDNTALWYATQANSTIALVILSPEQWKKHDDAPIKIAFYLRQLSELKKQLDLLNIPLHIEIIPLWKDIPIFITEFSQKHQIEHVYANIDLGWNELKRDAQVQKKLNLIQKDLILYHDRTIFPVGSIRNNSNQPYQVFSAFKKKCIEQLVISIPQPFPIPEVQSSIPLLEKFNSSIPSCAELNIPISKADIHLWPVGEDIAQNKLEEFIKDDISNYLLERDFPNIDSTSKLSTYLNCGILSVRQCLAAIFQSSNGYFQVENDGQQTWLNELIWREFYQHILFDFPRLSKHEPFKLNTQKIVWRKAPEDLEAWKYGQTGIPIVDAGMRQLIHTGWMHNRVRMIVAMFLTKNLLIDWRLGEQWFMQNLIDGDLAANNGGWQWCASTGTDAVPYFRIFNPISQSQKFDTEGNYIRKWVPELAHLDAKTIHEPYAKNPNMVLNYPKPIVDLKQSRVRALEAFKAIS